MEGDRIRRRLCSYEPGDRTAIAGPNGYLLGDADPSDLSVVDTWVWLMHEVTPSRFAEVISDDPSPFSEVANFGLVVDTHRSAQVVLRGDTIAEIVTGDSTAVLSCPHSADLVWYRLVDRPDSITVGPTRLDFETHESVAVKPVRLPLSGGVVPASHLAVVWSDRLERDGTSVAADGPPIMAPEPAGAAPSPVPHRTVRPAARADIGPTEQQAPADSPATTAPPEPDAGRLLALPGDPVAGAESAPNHGYDHLFGHTISRTVEEAAIRVPDEEPTAIQRLSVEAASRAATETPIEPARPVFASADGMIDSVPGASRPLTNAAGDTRVWDPPAGGEDEPLSPTDPAELTISRAALAQLASPTNLTPPGPSVHAVRCPTGHLNPLHLGTCRRCGSAIQEQSPITVPRPVLGVLRLSTGGEISLDRSVLLGRSPSPDRMIAGERPHVVKLPSPEQDISRDHLEVRIDGWHVLVTDLNSTNGTWVLRPGAPPERLRPDTPTMIEPGTSVSVAEEVTFTFAADA